MKNALVLGITIEALPERCYSFEVLSHVKKWFLFNTSTNYIDSVTFNNQTVKYFISRYLNYQNSKNQYNYYDLQDIKYEQIKW